MQTQVHGGDIYSKTYRLDFSTNINPFGMPDSVRQGATLGIELAVHYPDVRYRQLRNAIGTFEEIPADWIICGNGAAEVIFGLVLAKRPKKGLLVAPGFAEYEQALNTVGCEIEFYQCNPDAGYVIGEDYLDYLKKRPEIAFLCNPNNPTGLLLPVKLLEEIIDICSQQGTLLVLDECFLEFVEEKLQNPQKVRLHQTKHLFILKAFTKMYGMPGLRLGYGMCSDYEFLERMRSVLQPWNVSLPAQYAGIEALKEVDFVDQTREYVKKEREYMIDALKEMGLTVYDSKANYIFFQGPENLFQVCQEHGILIRDCSNYRSLYPGCYRVAVKLRKENDVLLEVIRQHCKK